MCSRCMVGPYWLGVGVVRYLTRHDWVLTSVHIGVVGLLFLALCELRWLTRSTLRGASFGQFSWMRLWRARRYFLWAAIGVVAAGILWAVSYAAIEGVTFAGRHPTAPSLLKTAVQHVAARFTADLYQAELWPRPNNWRATQEEVTRRGKCPCRKGFSRSQLRFRPSRQGDLLRAQLQSGQSGVRAASGAI